MMCRSWSVLVTGKNCRWPLTAAQAARRSPPFVGPEARGSERGPKAKILEVHDLVDGLEHVYTFFIFHILRIIIPFD